MALRPGRTRQRLVLIIGGGVVVLLIVLGILSGFYVDLLWFREVGFDGVFWSVFWSKVLLGLVFGVLFFVLLLANLLIARRLTPRYRVLGPEQEIIERYRAVFEPYARFILPGVSAFIALFVGIAAAAQWQTFLLWKSASPEVATFGAAFADDVFGRDPSFYIFILPFQKFLQGWFFSALVGTTLIVILAHYLSGGIRTQTIGERVTPQVKAHLSVLLGLIILVKAWGYYLGRFDLLVSPRGVVTGASYTDVVAQLPALNVLIVIAVICAVLFLVNIRMRGWIFPGLGVGLLALTSIVAGGIVPAFVQKFRVDPQELQKERTYIARNIEATRTAFGLDRIERPASTSVSEDLTAADLEENAATVENIRLWNPSILNDSYDQLQRIQPYYEFEDVDVDRYDIFGEQRLVMLSPREVAQTQIPGGGDTWQNQHLVFTHGYGVVASRVNAATVEGAPEFVLRDIPPEGEGIELDQERGAQIYYGELADVPYVVVGGSDQKEFNFPTTAGVVASAAEAQTTTSYSGRGGISIGSLFRRLTFAYRYRDVNLLISGLIDGDSKILINRDLETRVRKAAPFLEYDGDPYSAIVDGRLIYIWDAYTTTDLYPYSERVSLSDATGEQMTGQTNYIRNSVKAVVDAYDGTLTFYVADPEDPLIRVWSNAFPELFTDLSEVDPELEAHFRYPENLLQIQAMQFANYHITDPDSFYTKERFWAIPPALSITPDKGPTDKPMRPYYVLLKRPGEVEEEFVLFMPFTPFNRPNMVGYMIGQSDPGVRGNAIAVEFPTENVQGPQQVRARIDQDPAVTQQITLLGQEGSDVRFGDLLVIPIEDAFLYVQPLFLVSSQENAIPELQKVIVVHGSTVTIGDTLPEALAATFGEEPPEEEPPTGEEPPAEADVGALLAAALQHFQRAEELLMQGDLAGYQREIEAGRALVQRANELTGSPEPTPTATPTPTPTPTG